MIKKYKDYIILLSVFLLILFSSSINRFLSMFDNNLSIDTINNNYCESLESDYKDLLKINDFKINSGLNLRMSKVYLRNIYEFKNTVMIYKGKEDGIEEGMAVISDMGLIGVVDNTLASSSEVRLITNKSSNISVKVGDNYGILKMADGVLVVSNLQTYDVINIGDKVYTSGIGNLPGDIYVGEVTKINVNATEIEKIVEVKPGVDLDNINYVLVVDSNV